MLQVCVLYLGAVFEKSYPAWLDGKSAIGVTAGASAPEVLVEGVLARLQSLGADAAVELEGKQENIVFALPKGLRVVMVD